MTLDDLHTLREGWDFEAKLALGRDARGAVPASLWETYAAMANTFGGRILLGARELVRVGMLEPMGKGTGRSYRLRSAPVPAQAELFEASARVANSTRRGSSSTSPTSTSSTSTSSTSTSSTSTSSTSTSSTSTGPQLVAQVAASARVPTRALRAAIVAVCGEFQTLAAITEALNRTANAVRPQLRELLAEGALELLYPDTPSHPKQAYRARTPEAVP